MKSKNILTAILLIMCALCFIQAAYYYPLLPETVPSHFGASGRPDAWSSKSFFVIFYLVIVAVNAILFSSLSFWMSRLPVSLINLPHKEYWLAPERKEKTLMMLAQYLLLVASATELLLFDIFHQSFQVALGRAQDLSHPLVSLALYLSLVVVVTIRMVIKFSHRTRE